MLDEIFEHPDLGFAAPGFHGIDSVIVIRKEDYARQKFGRIRQQPQLGFGHDAERAFRADEQVDPVHPWAQTVAAGVLGRVRNRNRRGGEVDGVSTARIERAAAHQNHMQAQTWRRVSP